MVTRARHKELADFIQIIFHLGSLTYGKCSLHSLHRFSCLCRRRHTTLKFMTDETYQIINLLRFQLVFERPRQYSMRQRLQTAADQSRVSLRKTQAYWRNYGLDERNSFFDRKP